MRSVIKISYTVILTSFLYTQEDPIIKFIENAVKIYPDSVWIDPKFLEYLPDQMEKEIQRIPKTEKEYKKQLKGYPEENIAPFSDIILLLKDIITSNEWYAYWKIKGIDYFKWKEKVLRTFEKRRKLKGFVELYERKKYEELPIQKIFESEETVKNELFYYSDVVIQGRLVKIEDHPEDVIYGRWGYVKVNKVIWGEESMDTIIVKVPWFEVSGLPIVTVDFEGWYRWLEKDIGREYILFLTRFPFNKLLSLPYLIYAYKRKKSMNNKMRFLENTFLSLWEEDEIKIEEFPQGVYQPMYFTKAFRVFENKVGLREYGDQAFIKGTVSLVAYDKVMSLLNSSFKGRKK